MMDRELFQLDVVLYYPVMIETLSQAGYSQEEITNQINTITYNLNQAYLADEISNVQPMLSGMLYGLTIKAA